MFNFIANWRREREAVGELSRMTDHQLADLGISRADIWAAVYGTSPARHEEAAAQGADAMAPSWGHHNRRALAA